MSANCVLPPFDGMLTARSSEYLAGVTLNELSECQRRLPIANSRRRSSRGYGLLFLSRLETSAKVVGRRVSLAARRLVPIACSIGPRLWVKASCCSSVMCCWLRNTSTAYLSMPAWMAATSAAVIGFAMSMPSTSPAMPGPTCRIVIAIVSASASYFSGENLAGMASIVSWRSITMLGIARRRPDALGDGLAADALALAHVLVGPDMDPLVERADVGVAGEDQRRQGRARRDVLGPGVHHLGDHAPSRRYRCGTRRCRHARPARSWARRRADAGSCSPC